MRQPLLALLLITAASASCPQAGGWTRRAHSCYKWFSEPRYWFHAEQTCLSQRAHLASIGSEQENRLVGRLSHCRDAWIGRFGVDLDRLADPTSYRWTDGSDAVSFERHNFSELDSVHKPLIRSDGVWWLNSLYHERHPFVCELGLGAAANSSSSDSGGEEAADRRRRCPSGWSLHNNQCYVMPHFEANFNEANFYCQRNSSHLVSVLTRSELDFVNELSFGIDSCEKPAPDRLDSVWIGLIKLNPCFPDSAGRELCYQWTDFSGKHAGLPAWETGHPDSADWTVNCVTLSGGRLRSDRCHSRHRFVCKSAASGGGVTSSPDGGVTSSPDGGVTSSPDGGVTSSPDGGFNSSPDGGVTRSPDRGFNSSPDGGVTSSPDGGVTSSPGDSSNPPSPPHLEGLVAAFDFRRSLVNLVDPRTFAIHDEFGVNQTNKDGACFKKSSHANYRWEFYRVGDRVSSDDAIWNSDEWTIYLRMNVSSRSLRTYFLRVPFNISDIYGSRSNFWAEVHQSKATSSVLFVDQRAHSNDTEWFWHYNLQYFSHSDCFDSWCDVRLAVKNGVLDPGAIGTPSDLYYSNGTRHSAPELGPQQLLLGLPPGSFYEDNQLCVRCFGLASRRLSADEVKRALAAYCP